MSELAVIESDVAALDALDPESREVAVTGILNQAHEWLERAKMATDPARRISEFKAYIATVAETTKQLKMSREVQADATVMVRRTERALGVALREGQERGEIGSKDAKTGRPAKSLADASRLSSPYDFAKHTELYGDGREGGNGVYAMADNVTDEQFEEALTEAREEGNVSRSNVVRKIRAATEYPAEVSPPKSTTSNQKRKPLPEQFFNAVYDFGKAVDRLEALAADDRFARSRADLALSHLATLQRHAETISTIASKLETR